MFDMQTIVYGFCGFLAALSISHPSFHIKYSRRILVLAWGCGVAIVFATFVVLQVVEDTGFYKIYINDYLKKLTWFLVEDKVSFITYMFASAFFNEFFIWIAKTLEKHNSHQGK